MGTFALVDYTVGMDGQLSPWRNLRVIEVTAWVLLIVLTAIILKKLAFLFIPLSIGLLLSYASGVPLDMLRRWGVPSYLQIVLVVLFILTVLFLFGTLIQANVALFAEQLPEFEKKFLYNLYKALNWLGIEKELEKIYADLPRTVGGTNLQPFGMLMQRVGGSFFSFIVNIFWVLLFMVFILIERESITNRLIRGLGSERSESFLKTLELINSEVQHYLGLKIMISFFTGVVVTMTLWLLDVPFALLWGSTAFLLNLVPYIGSIVASLPPVAITFFETGDLGKTVAVGAVMFLIQMSIGNVIEPQIMGRSLNLSPLLILLSLVFWGWMWGVTGMFLAIPLTGAMKIALERIESTRFLAVMMGGK